MDVSPQTFWLYTFAVCALVWGILGLRFAIGVLGANAVLAYLLFGLRGALGDNALYALLFCYPVYWGIVFALLGKLDRLQFPSPGPIARFFIGLILALALFGLARQEDLKLTGKIYYAAFLADVSQRPVLIGQALAETNPDKLCNESYANLMNLALNAHDGEVTEVLVRSFSVCPRASRTIQAVVKPMLDAGEKKKLSFLLQHGLKPSSLVFGADYANGSALAYAATATGHPDIVRMIAERNTEDARKMKYFSTMIETLLTQDNTVMLDALDEAGLETGR